ncbi:Uncharacterised protein [Vibrio cholerae]|nr:Uncharacterised protein [Vibrio cholerae]
MRCNFLDLIVHQATVSRDTSPSRIVNACGSHTALSNVYSNRITFDNPPLSFLDDLAPRMLRLLVEG